MKKSTIYDVAKLAEVSTATVSRYLNKNSYIEKEKVRAIEEAIFQLNYQPRKKRKGHRSMTIGVVAPSLNDPFSLKILEGIRSVSSHQQYLLDVQPSNWNHDREAMLLSQFKACKVDSIIIIVGSCTFLEVKSLVGDIPVLFVCRKNNDLYPVLWSDNVIGGSIATTHLLQLGHQRIAHITGSEDSFDSIDRKQGYIRSLENAGIAIDESLIVEGSLSLEGGYNAVKRLLDNKVNFTAIFAANDLSALGAVQALNQNGFSVPDDVSVIGFDDIEISDYFIPRLTTIKQPLFDIGRLAYLSILDIMCGEVNKQSIPPFEVVVRDSTMKQSRNNYNQEL